MRNLGRKSHIDFLCTSWYVLLLTTCGGGSNGHDRYYFRIFECLCLRLHFVQNQNDILSYLSFLEMEKYSIELDLRLNQSYWGIDKLFPRDYLLTEIIQYQ